MDEYANRFKTLFEEAGCTTGLPEGSIATKPIKSLDPIAPGGSYAYPSPEEFAQFKKGLKSSPVTLSAADLKARQDFQAEWQKKNRAIAPYVGAWKTAENQDVYVFPSKVAGRVCVLRSKDGKLSPDLGVSMTTDMRYDGNNGLFKVDTPEVVAGRSDKTQPLSALYGAIGSPDVSSVKGELEQAQCISELPKGIVVAKKDPMVKPIVVKNPIEVPKPEPKPSENPISTTPSNTVCPSGTEYVYEPVYIEPKQEYDNQSPSYAFLETTGPKGDGKRSDGSKILADTRCIFIKELSNPKTPRRTWLFIHGWDSDSTGGDIIDLAETAKSSYPNDRVLILDWSEASRNNGHSGSKVRGVYYAASWIKPVSEVAGKILTDKYGIHNDNASSTLNIVGHSLGTFVGAEIGAGFTNGINYFLAFDPASDLSSKGELWGELKGYDIDGRTPAYKKSSSFLNISVRDLIEENIDKPRCFGAGIQGDWCNSSKRVAKFSRAFVGKLSAAGNQGFAKSADESFRIDFGARFVAPGTEHGEVVKVFNSLVKTPNLGLLLGLDDENAHAELKRDWWKYGDHYGEIKVDSISGSLPMLFVTHRTADTLVIKNNRAYRLNLLCPELSISCPAGKTGSGSITELFENLPVRR